MSAQNLSPVTREAIRTAGQIEKTKNRLDKLSEQFKTRSFSARAKLTSQKAYLRALKKELPKDEVEAFEKEVEEITEDSTAKGSKAKKSKAVNKQ